MRFLKNSSSDNERFRPKQNCEVILFNFFKAVKDRLQTCKFRNFHDFHKTKDGKRKNTAFGEAT
jgi:hypothetical protein